jgi:hypothetical protein
VSFQGGRVSGFEGAILAVVVGVDCRLLHLGNKLRSHFHSLPRLVDAVMSVPEVLVKDEFISIWVGFGTRLQVGMLLLAVLDDNVFRGGAHVTIVANEPGQNQ